MHLADQHREPQRDQPGQPQRGALAEAADLGIELAAVAGHHHHHRLRGTRQLDLLGHRAQRPLQRPAGVIGAGRAGRQRGRRGE
jgi:hypothetical protein